MPVYYFAMTLQVNITANAGLATQLDMSGDTTVQSLRPRLYAMTGFSQESMKIKVNGAQVDDETKTLSQLASGTIVNIEVTGVSEFGDLDDTSGVTKFEISDEDYDKRKGTLREMKRKMGIPVKGEVKESGPPEGIEVGQRCEAELGDGSKRRGEVKYVGKVDGTKGWWVGIQLDEAWGKNNGSLKGKVYFTCEDNYGIFCRPNKVEVGDFPEIDWEAELADEM